VGSAVAAAWSAEGAGAAAAGVRRRPVGAPLAGLLLAAPPFLAGPTGGFLLGPAAGLLGVALAGPVGGLLAGIGAEAALAAWVVGLGERSAAVLAVPPDDPHGVSPA
jgi:hypothetical protein